eukprot:gene43396-18537_t
MVVSEACTAQIAPQERSRDDVVVDDTRERLAAALLSDQKRQEAAYQENLAKRKHKRAAELHACVLWTTDAAADTPPSLPPPSTLESFLARPPDEALDAGRWSAVPAAGTAATRVAAACLSRPLPIELHAALQAQLCCESAHGGDNAWVVLLGGKRRTAAPVAGGGAVALRWLPASGQPRSGQPALHRCAASHPSQLFAGGAGDGSTSYPAVFVSAGGGAARWADDTWVVAPPGPRFAEAAVAADRCTLEDGSWFYGKNSVTPLVWHTNAALACVAAGAKDPPPRYFHRAIVAWPAFSSTSDDMGVAVSFAHGWSAP